MVGTQDSGRQDEGQEVLDRAIQTALKYHNGQVNKFNGEPYLLHVFRVAKNIRDAGFDMRYQAIAWLHDVLEDTPCTSDVLLETFSIDIVSNVEALTKKKGQSNKDYYRQLLLHKKAAIVKYYGDIPENFGRIDEIEDLETKERLTQKYLLGIEILGEKL